MRIKSAALDLGKDNETLSEFSDFLISIGEGLYKKTNNPNTPMKLSYEWVKTWTNSNL